MWCTKVMPLSADAVGELEVVERLQAGRRLDLRGRGRLEPGCVLKFGRNGPHHAAARWRLGGERRGSKTDEDERRNASKRRELHGSNSTASRTDRRISRVTLVWHGRAMSCFAHPTCTRCESRAS